MLLPVHQNVKVGRVLLPVRHGLAFAHQMDPHDRRGADHANLHVLTCQDQELQFSAGGIRNEGCLIFDAAICVAVAEFRRSENLECLGVRRDLGSAERFDVFLPQQSLHPPQPRRLVHRARNAPGTILAISVQKPARCPLHCFANH